MAAKKILVVDDTAAHLQLLKDIVSKAGHLAITASSGKDAVTKAESEKPSMILMDIVMEDMDGYGACREITRGENTRNIPIVFVSSKFQRADKIWAEKQGAKALLSKPVDEAEVVKYIGMYT